MLWTFSFTQTLGICIPTAEPNLWCHSGIPENDVVINCCYSNCEREQGMATLCRQKCSIVTRDYTGVNNSHESPKQKDRASSPSTLHILVSWMYKVGSKCEYWTWHSNTKKSLYAKMKTVKNQNVNSVCLRLSTLDSQKNYIEYLWQITYAWGLPQEFLTLPTCNSKMKWG